jgi:outer membrane protein TolC
MKKIPLNTNETKLVILVLLFLFNSIFLVAQSPKTQKRTLNDTSTLKEILTEAALNNPGLKAAFHQWQAALEKVPQVRALPDPQLTFAYFIREIETRVGPQRQKIGIMQMFPWFGKRKLRGSAAAEAANAAKQHYQTVKLDLFYRIKDIYYDYYYAAKTASVLEENVRLLKYLEEVIRSKYRTGTASFAGLVKIQVELDKLTDRLNSAKEILRPLQARLNAVLNRPLNASLLSPKRFPRILLNSHVSVWSVY